MNTAIGTTCFSPRVWFIGFDGVWEKHCFGDLFDERLECSGGRKRAKCGKKDIVTLAEQLAALYGPSFDFTNLYKFTQFYREFPIFDSLCLKSGEILGWSHGSEQLFASKYKLLLPTEEELRAEIEAQKMFWIEQHGNLENTKEVRS